jgi:hypothetical protein
VHTPPASPVSCASAPTTLVHGDPSAVLVDSLCTESTVFSSQKQFQNFPGKACHFAEYPLSSIEILVQSLVLNQNQFLATTLHLDPSTPSKLHLYPYLFIQKPLELSRFIFHPLNFFPPYLFNRNSELGDSCVKILRNTSFISLNYLYSYEC